MALGDSRRKRKSSAAPKLMLTSMMDMFTIVLIFLLFSFSENPETIKLDKDLELPRSSAELKYDKNLKLVLTKNSLMLEDEVISELENGKIKGIDEKNLKSSDLFKRLKEHYEMSIKAADENKTAETNPDEKTPGREIVFLCDKKHEFKTINQVMKTAGLAGYPNFQFAVLQD